MLAEGDAVRWAVLLLLVSCNEPVEYESCTQLPFYRVSCETHPELCDLPVSTLRSSGNPRAYHLVFLPEGFTESELPAFRRHVRELVADLWDDEGGVVHMGRDLFDAHLVEVPSRTSLITNGERHDTAIGGCLADDFLGVGPAEGRVDPARAQLAAMNAPGADAVIVIFANGAPRANVFAGAISLALDDNAKTLTHELGHALFGLGDEYTETPECFPEERFEYETGPSDMLGIANLTLDPHGRKWRHAWSGSLEGGRRYGDCIYHPTNDCRMLASQSDDFCPVCAGEIRLRMGLRRDPTRNDGPPLCEIASREDPMDLKGEWILELRTFDRTPPVRAWIALDHAVVWTSSLAGPIANRLRVPVRPGKHVAMVQCTDRFGAISTARMDAFAH